MTEADLSVLPGAAVQRGVGYRTSTGLTFGSGAIVPLAATVRVRQTGGRARTVDKAGAPVRMESSGHHLVLEADFKLKTGTNMPVLGEVLTDGTNGWKWVVTDDPVCVGMVGELPAIVQLTVEYWPDAQGDL